MLTKMFFKRTSFDFNLFFLSAQGMKMFCARVLVLTFLNLFRLGADTVDTALPFLSLSKF